MMQQLFMDLVNPWELSLLPWLVALACKESVIQALDVVITFAGGFIDLLPSRKGDIKITQRPLGLKDLLFLSTNSVIEFIFASQVLFFLYHSDRVDWPLTKFGVCNGPVALWLLVVTNDLFYAPLHRLLHTPLLYRWIHKHHHYSIFPQRGNLDARNEHPLEQILALSFWYLAIRLTALCTGLHAATMLAQSTLMAVLACFNHTDFDVRFSILGLDFAVRAHEMHHRRPDKNFGQVIMLIDRVMGTYVPYATRAC